MCVMQLDLVTYTPVTTLSHPPHTPAEPFSLLLLDSLVERPSHQCYLSKYSFRNASCFLDLELAVKKVAAHCRGCNRPKGYGCCPWPVSFSAAAWNLCTPKLLCTQALLRTPQVHPTCQDFLALVWSSFLWWLPASPSLVISRLSNEQEERSLLTLRDGWKTHHARRQMFILSFYICRKSHVTRQRTPRVHRRSYWKLVGIRWGFSEKVWISATTHCAVRT